MIVASFAGVAFCLLSVPAAVSQDWTPTSSTGAPAGYRSSSAVWTGQAMIVWGGIDQGGTPHGTGARYDPVSDTWSPISSAGAPTARWQHSAVWTGSTMIIWGGNDNGTQLNDGGIYDPIADNWTAVTTTGAPAGRYNFTAVWTGTEMIIWGGNDNALPSIDTGARYNPVTNSWSPVTLTSAPAARTLHTAVWTGTEMIVWGGNSSAGSTAGGLASGGRYNPVSDSWTATSLVGAPVTRHAHVTAWIGSRMLVWGGLSSAYAPAYVTNTGGLYDPASDQWTSTSLKAAADPKAFSGIVFTGNEIIVWAGNGGNGPPPTGGRYNPARDEWTPVGLGGSPSALQEFVDVWTGSEMIIWGGDGAKGGRYRPPPLTALEADGSCTAAISIAAPDQPALIALALVGALSILLLRLSKAGGSLK